ncbi:MAG: carboxypeptidase-like regulatory domain-containing protein [Candidatus Andersenbacteria bacterium]
MTTIPRGRVIDIATNIGVASARVMIYDATGKLHSTLTTNMQGEFSTAFPKGEYGITVRSNGYKLAPEVAQELTGRADVIYDGGTFVISADDELVDMIVPVKNENSVEVHAHTSQSFLQRLWSVFSKNNRKNNEAFGIVRDAQTKEALDLAVIRLFDENAEQLLATKITDIHGRFALFPSPGIYKLTATLEGYQDFTREHITLTPSDNSVLFTPIDLVRKSVL